MQNQLMSSPKLPKQMQNQLQMLKQFLLFKQQQNLFYGEMIESKMVPFMVQNNQVQGGLILGLIQKGKSPRTKFQPRLNQRRMMKKKQKLKQRINHRPLKKIRKKSKYQKKIKSQLKPNLKKLNQVQNQLMSSPKLPN